MDNKINTNHKKFYTFSERYIHDGNYMIENPCGRFIEKRFLWISYGDDRFPCVANYLDYIKEVELIEKELDEFDEKLDEEFLFQN